MRSRMCLLVLRRLSERAEQRWLKYHSRTIFSRTRNMMTRTCGLSGLFGSRVLVPTLREQCIHWAEATWTESRSSTGASTERMLLRIFAKLTVCTGSRILYIYLCCCLRPPRQDESYARNVRGLPQACFPKFRFAPDVPARQARQLDFTRS